SYGIGHLARSTQHTSMMDDPILLSGLILRTTSGRQEVISAGELATLDLVGTQLVVLSACQTGLGMDEPGEGVIGLRRALWVAGARAEVVSLWKVPDAATAVLMTHFYHEIRNGVGIGDALRRAQIAMQREGFGNPRFWAGFI